MEVYRQSYRQPIDKTWAWSSELYSSPAILSYRSSQWRHEKTVSVELRGSLPRTSSSPAKQPLPHVFRVPVPRNTQESNVHEDPRLLPTPKPPPDSHADVAPRSRSKERQREVERTPGSRPIWVPGLWNTSLLLGGALGGRLRGSYGDMWYTTRGQWGWPRPAVGAIFPRIWISFASDWGDLGQPDELGYILVHTQLQRNQWAAEYAASY